jgi:hypothetical protein
MALLTRKLSTGDVMVFNKESRDLVLISPSHAQEWERSKDKSAEFAKKMAQDNHATFFSRQSLDVLQSALAHIIHLE